MIVYERGASMGKRSLGLVLREGWRLRQEDRLARIAKRKSNAGVPPSDDPPCEKCGRPAPELKPLADYDGDPGLDGLRVEFAALSRERFETLSAAWEASVGLDRKPMLEAGRAILEESLLSLDGLERADGSAVEVKKATFGASTVEMLEDNKLFDALILAWGYLHQLEGDARKNCGASQPSTSGSRSGTATLALAPSESGRDVTEEGPPSSGRSLEEGATPHAPAPAAS